MAAAAQDWLGQFLSKRDLVAPDGRPLYGYRASKEELASLQSLVGGIPAARVGVMLPRPEAACFCLFAAEWWRCNHEGGPWKWSGIMESVGWGHIAQQCLYVPIQEGLGYWSRPLLTRLAGRMFLVTLACEGGLPLKLLHQQHAWLRCYFQALLHDFHRFRRYGTTAIELARGSRDILPQRLQQEVVFELGGTLAEVIWEMQSELGDTKTPVADLDRREPKWRDRMPLVVEDDTARALLNNLLEDATRIAARQASGFSLARTLRRSADGTWLLEANVGIPPSIDAEALAEVIGVDRNSLPSRMQIILADGDDLIQLGLATRISASEEDRFTVEGMSPNKGRLQGVAASRAHCVSAATGGRIVGQVAIKGGNELGDLPWVFIRSAADDVLEMVGEGAVKTRNPDAFVAVQETWRGEAQEDGMCDPLGMVDVEARRLYRVTGTARFVDPDGGQCLVRCGAPQDESVEYCLEGPTLPYGSHGGPVFLGVPRLVQLSSSGGRIQLPSTRIECRTWLRRDPWRTLTPESVGDLAVRYAEDGNTRFRARMQVIPPDATVILAPDRSGRSGEIQLTGWRQPDIRLACPSTVEARVEAQTDRIKIIASTVRDPPATLACHLSWPDGQLELEFPFPVRSGRFIGRDGNVLKHEAVVSIDRLAGIRTILIDTQEGRHFGVHAVLFHVRDVSPEIANTFVAYRPLDESRPREHVLDLRHLQEQVCLMLGMSRELDAMVELRIESNDSEPLRPRKLFVQRYDGTFDLDRDLGEVRLGASLLASFESDGFDRLETEAFPMSLPDEAPVSLAKNGPGRWHFEPQKRAPGPWLIIGREGSWVRLRPTLWSVRGAPDSTAQVERLAGVVCVADPDVRSAKFDLFLQGLASDPNHPDWQSVFSYFQRYQLVPASTMMLFERMILNPEATAMCLMSAPEEHFDVVWSKLEELPFLWALVPTAAWLRAARRIAQPLRDAGMSGRSIEGLFSTFARKAPARLSGLRTITKLVSRRVVGCGENTAGFPATTSSKNAIQKELQEAQQYLMSVHAAERWPTGTSTNEFKAMIPELPSFLKGLWRDPLVSYRDTVTNAPVATALAALAEVTLPALAVHDIRRCRQFDPAWFDRAYDLSLAMAVALLPEAYWGNA